jgi:hypothetical protein
MIKIVDDFTGIARSVRPDINTAPHLAAELTLIRGRPGGARYRRSSAVMRKSFTSPS